MQQDMLLQLVERKASWGLYHCSCLCPGNLVVSQSSGHKDTGRFCMTEENYGNLNNNS